MGGAFLNSRAYGGLEVVIDFLLLSLLWLLLCLPIVTIAPATAALFGVVRGWLRDGVAGVVTEFFALLRENFLQSLLVGAVWALVGLSLLADLFLIGQVGAFLRFLLLIVTGVFGLAYLGASVYLFPVMVHYRTSWTGVIRNAGLAAISQPLLTLLGLAVIAAVALLTAVLPFTLLLTASPAAYVIYRWCDMAFDRLDGSGVAGKGLEDPLEARE